MCLWNDGLLQTATRDCDVLRAWRVPKRQWCAAYEPNVIGKLRQHRTELKGREHVWKVKWEASKLANKKAKQSRCTPWWRLGGEEYSSCSFLTSALDWGEWSASRPGRALPPGKGPPVPIVQEAGWASEPVWTQRLEEKSFTPARDRTPIAQSVVRHYTDWATRLPFAANTRTYFTYESMTHEQYNTRLYNIKINI
jgi:hypothetical protein